MKHKNTLIEGIHEDKSGGRTIEGDLTVTEIVNGVNSLLKSYPSVALCFDYPHGETHTISKEIDESHALVRDLDLTAEEKEGLH